jgi:hypothetical protein
MLEHMPNGGMFTIGTMSAIAAAGRPSIVTLLIGRMFSVVGARPKEHCSKAPVVTDALPISRPF